jgi:uncharacterized membrane protein
VRRYHDEEDDEQYQFWSGILVAIPVCIALWVLALAGAVHVARLLGWIS